MAKSSGSSSKSSGSSTASKSTSSAAKSTSGSTASKSYTVTNSAGKSAKVSNVTSAQAAAIKKAGGTVTTNSSGGSSSSGAAPKASTPSTKSYVVYDPKSGKTVVASLTAAQVATANKMGINTVERSAPKASTSSTSSTTADDSGDTVETKTPVKTQTAQQKAADTLVKKGIAYAKDGNKLNIQVNSDLGGATDEQIKSWEAAGHKVTVVTTADIQKDKNIGLVKKDDKEAKPDALTVKDDADTTLNDTWDKVGKDSDPEQMSEFLNSQTGDKKFETKVVGDKVVGKKNGVETTWKFDGENWVVDTEAKAATAEAETDAAIDPFNKEVLQQESDAISEKNKESIRVQEENINRLEDLYAQQDKAIQGRYSDMWKLVKESEAKGLAYLDEIDALGRKQFEDNAAQVARKLSGRASAQAAALAGQGFDASVIANLAGQLDSQYADERLLAQQKQLDNLDSTRKAYQDLYTELQTNSQNLTSNERTFMEGIGDRIQELDKNRELVATMKGDAMQPWIDYWKKISTAASTSAVTDATSKGYQATWDKNDATERVAMLRSNLNAFLSTVVDANGAPKYNLQSITEEQLLEIAKNPNMQSAYEKAAAIITNGEIKDAKLPATGGSTGGSGSTGSTPTPKKGSTPASAPEAAKPTGDSGLDSAINAALAEAKALNDAKGFSKTNLSLAQYTAIIKSAKTVDEVNRAKGLIAAAVGATPGVAATKALSDQLRTALGAYSNLTAAQKTVLNGTPGANTEVMKLIKEANAAYSKGDAKKLASASAQLKKIIDAYLAGKQKGPFIQGAGALGGVGPMAIIPTNGGKSTTTNIPTTIVEA